MQQGICNKRAAACISNSQIVGPLSSNNSDDTNFYDRAHEREIFDALLGQRPASIRVVLGPTNCGKSTLLRNYVLHQQLSNGMCYIDCRQFDCTTPDRFAEVFAQQALPVLVQNIPWKHWEQSKRSVLYAAALFYWGHMAAYCKAGK
jgi:polynucleotide 5'-kinase involved in rRNA processing